MNTKLNVSILVFVGGLLIASSAQSQTESSISTTGEIESKKGFRFPDNSLQETAAQDELYNLDCDNGQATIYDATGLKWVCADPLQGPQGEKGDKGDTGDAGANGAPGLDGAPGANCWEAVGGSTIADCIGASGADGEDGAHGQDGVSCSVSVCEAEGEATLSCGETSVQVPCVPQLFDIGDTGPAGGIVIYVTDGGVRGLEVARVDQGTAGWCPEFRDVAGVDNIGAAATPDSHSGAHNTPLIIAECGLEFSAAGKAAAYVWPEGQMDGFLPNKEELNLVHQNMATIDNFERSTYWSSSEKNVVAAWQQIFFDGDELDGSQEGTPQVNSNGVRAVRAF